MQQEASSLHKQEQNFQNNVQFADHFIIYRLEQNDLKPSGIQPQGQFINYEDNDQFVEFYGLFFSFN